MSKKELNKTASMEATPVATETFDQIVGDRPFPTLKAIAAVFDVPQQRIYSIAKQPIAGQVYDAKVYNWAAITKFISKRIGHEGDVAQTMEEVYTLAMEKDEEFANSDRRHARTGTGSGKKMLDLGDGKQMPERKIDVAVGDTIYFKKDSESYKVVLVTATHICYQLLTESGEETPTLGVLSNWTFNQKYAKAPSKVVAVETNDTPDAE